MSEAALRTAVVGVGYLGRFHAQKHKALADVELLAVSDANLDGGSKVAAELGVSFEPDFRNLVGRVDAVTIAASTQAHYEIAAFFLEHKVPVFVEKPLAATLEQARRLVELADANKVLLQVGHIERFNPAFRSGLQGKGLRAPQFLKASRRGVFNRRGSDVDVVLDLMIHDLDLALNLNQGAIASVQGVGVDLLGLGSFDEVHGWVQWESGAKAQFEASRAALRPQRTFEAFIEDQNMSAICRLDLGAGTWEQVTMDSAAAEKKPAFEQKVFEKVDGLQLETRYFVDAVRQKSVPPVTGSDGLKAMELAFAIIESAYKTKKDFTYRR